MPAWYDPSKADTVEIPWAQIAAKTLKPKIEVLDAGGGQVDNGTSASANEACKIKVSFDWKRGGTTQHWLDQLKGMPAEWEIKKDGQTVTSRDELGATAKTHSARWQRRATGFESGFGGAGTHIVRAGDGGTVDVNARTAVGKWKGELKIGGKVALTTGAVNVK